MKNPAAFPTGLKGKCVLEGGRYDEAIWAYNGPYKLMMMR